MIVGSPRAPVRLVAATGIVGAAVGAHVAAGAAMPSPLLLVGLVLGLTVLMALLPARLCSLRMSLGLAVLVQPALHVLFDRMPTSGAPAGPAADAGMAVAHLAAAGFGAWLLARGAARLVAACAGLPARLIPMRTALVPPPARTFSASATTSGLQRRWLSAGVSRRGPPTKAQPIPVV